MKKNVLALGTLSLALSAALLAPLSASAQNIAVVNGKPVPKERAEVLKAQLARQGQPITPEIERQIKDEVVLREIFVQEAERRGIAASENYKQQLELTRQALLIRELFAEYQRTNPITAEEIQAKYDEFKAQAGGKEYRARHILVEKEDEAKKLIADLKRGAKFEDLALKNSKDPGSAKQGGDLDWSPADRYVPEFSDAMVKLEKGKFTEQPVKSQFGYHVIKLEDVRDVELPTLEQVRPQIEQALMQQKIAQFRDDLRKNARTDYKFEQQ
ncbi:peptidylprolyl isomerase [Caldimonas thermodepolymerans]|jgi:peptidyl-prolyl cis-trans isomerase C|uniref:peptidylprolyl isomerase n=1 Tax=Caldimonas thermodepolymerans TaxID=215580 RepID=A0A2S5T6H7_9BURK|nr:peptidylprolyl isomerase [Caldimonas thermodepolymerans]PPE70604.1 peptidylprolyl isomerase [Caldimonas thermodepolymerans]QPC30013.1 peptidylprolyl isomerase [Caldimonas thermodepolymerans]RDH97637.1 peptidyl-prolyl cis-trans isomerase C [Caldimonas thermodepolymerans]TCP10050.1 peptidyl-prolyl cis-trans isomerase C [Caldimonas thermodepolymerans]UZG42758.1 peptidylprolyl isomerase [Caldimonas thermodepolymerans]